MDDIDRVLDFWLGPLDAEGQADEAHRQRWFTKDPAFDEELRRRFLSMHEAVRSGAHESWLQTPRGRLAYVIVLDQFSRNLFRGTPASFAGDDRALAVAKEAVTRGDDRQVSSAGRGFFYLPFMHAEDGAIQEQCVALYQAWLDEAAAAARPFVEYALDYARQHRDIIHRFGRFPHRNDVLGRTSTDEERAFLQTPGSSF